MEDFGDMLRSIIAKPTKRTAESSIEEWKKMRDHMLTRVARLDALIKYMEEHPEAREGANLSFAFMDDED